MTPEQAKGAQSEVQTRESSPYGMLSRAVPMLFKNESRFTASHSSRPVGAKVADPMSNKALTSKARANKG
jgi:hypothetical protein